MYTRSTADSGREYVRERYGSYRHRDYRQSGLLTVMDIKSLASGSSGNAYRISDGKTALLLDAGIPYKNIQIGCGFKTSDIRGCLITHSHTDHSKGAKELIKRGIDVYTSKGTAEACGLHGHRVHTVADRRSFKIGTLTVTQFDVQHDAPEPLGFLAASEVSREKVLYFTDTYYLKYCFSGLTHILGECNYDRASLDEAVRAGITAPELGARIIKSHMSLENFLDFLKANDLSRVRRIYLLHLSENHSDAERMKKAVQELTGTEVYTC